MPSIFSLDDLNTTIDSAPRIQDYLLGEKLGFERPRDIRPLIKNSLGELGGFGLVPARPAPIISGKGRETMVNEYWLNEPQAIYVCMRSRAKNSIETRKEIVQVFEELRAKNNQCNQWLSGQNMHSHTRKPHTTGEFCNV